MSYTHLTENDRYKISYLKSARFSLREIARRKNDTIRPSAENLEEMMIHCTRITFTGTTGLILKRLSADTKPGIIDGIQIRIL